MGTSLFVIVAPFHSDYIGMWTGQIISPAIAVSVLVGVVFSPSGAAAQPANVRIAYAAAKGCPGGDQFVAAVAARGRFVVAIAGDSPSAMRVAIMAEPTGYRGTLKMGASDAGAREVRGASCQEVVDALAVVTVSSLGPAEGNAGSNPSIEAPAAPAPRDAKAADPATPSVPTIPPVHLETGYIGAAPKEVAVGAGTLRFDRDISIGAFGGVTTGIVPSVVLPRFDFEFARTNFVTSPEGHSYRVVPTVRLHATFFGTGEYHSGYGTTEADGLAIGADLCSPVYYDRTGLGGAPMRRTHGGLLWGSDNEPAKCAWANEDRGLQHRRTRTRHRVQFRPSFSRGRQAGWCSRDRRRDGGSGQRLGDFQIVAFQPERDAWRGWKLLMAGGSLPHGARFGRASAPDVPDRRASQVPTGAAGTGGQSESGKGHAEISRITISEPALRRLFETYYASIWALLRRLGVHSAELDDAAQQVFWIAAQKLAEIRPGSEHAFLYGVAVRIASREHRRRRGIPVTAEVNELARICDLHPSPEEQLEHRRARALLDVVLDRMPIELRTVFVLCELEELEVRQAAALEDIPIGTASSRLRRAREEFSAIAKRLRATLLARGGSR